MKTLLFTTLIILTMVATYFIYPKKPDTLGWINDYNKALKVAQKENKNIYMFIAADKCKYCKMFKEQTLSQQNVIDKLNEEFVLLYLSRDQHFIPEGFERFGAPRHYFLTPKGEVIFDSFGFLEPHGFFLLLDEYDLHLDD